VSSWTAFYTRYRGEQPNSIALRAYRAFRQYRPFIRRGEDYLLLHSLIHDGVPVHDQRQFDAAVERAGWEDMATYRALLYTVREEMVDSDLENWLALHAPYRGVVESLAPLVADPEVWIVSTKRSEFVVKILAGWSINWPIDRTIMPVSRTKVQIVESVMERLGMSEAVLVDDQVDHLRCEEVQGLRCCLASWGHVSPESGVPDHVERIDLDQFRAMLEKQATRQTRRSSPRH
jgi:hypothetical protein